MRQAVQTQIPLAAPVCPKRVDSPCVKGTDKARTRRQSFWCRIFGPIDEKIGTRDGRCGKELHLAFGRRGWGEQTDSESDSSDRRGCLRRLNLSRQRLMWSRPPVTQGQPARYNRGEKDR